MTNTENSYINSIIGEGTTFKGDINIGGLLRIDGDYRGSIKSTGKILIGKTGRAECNINADTVVIGGAVKGNIRANKRIAILSSSLVIGNLTAPRLDIEDKVICHGKIAISKEVLSTEFNSEPLSSTDEINNDKYNPALKQ